MNAEFQDKLALIIGANIASRRKKKNISQRSLAERVNLTYSAMCRIEAGVSSSRVSRLQAIATCLECPVADLFRSPDDPSCSVFDDIACRVSKLQKEAALLVVELRRLNRMIK